MRLKKDFNGSDRETRATLKSNFQIIEDNFNNELNSYNNRISKLEQTSATHDEVRQVSQEWNKRASHIARGTDIATTRAVVMQILASIGQVDLSKLSDADEKIVTKDEFDAFVNKVKGKINLDN
jgi:hypothetical protein